MTVRLSQILSTRTSKDDSSRMEELIIEELKSLDGVTYDVDAVGNISAVKGTSAAYTAFICHTDSSAADIEDFNIIRLDRGIWVAHTTNREGKQVRTRMGGDKIGVFLCLKLLKMLDAVKVVFFTDEIPDGGGVRQFNLDFFDNCKFIIGLDLNGSTKISTRAYGEKLASKSFEDDLTEVGKDYGYCEENLVVPHLYSIRKRPGLKISFALISVGFWNPFGNNEHVVEQHVNKAYMFCRRIDEKLKTKYIHHWEDRFERPYQLLKPAVEIIPKTKTIPRCSANGCSNMVLVDEHKYCMQCINILVREKITCDECNLILINPTDVCHGICARCRPLRQARGASVGRQPSLL